MSHYKHRKLTQCAAGRARRASTVPIPSGAWVKTLQIPPESPSLFGGRSTLARQLHAPGRIADEPVAQVNQPQRCAYDGVVD